MTLRSRVALIAFVLWTMFVWANRISNTLRSTSESSMAKGVSVTLSVIMLALAVGVVVVLVGSWSSTVTSGGGKVLVVAAGVTALVWMVRVPQILFANHDAAFKMVHVMLGLISVVLAALVWQQGVTAVRSDQQASSAMEDGRV